MLFTVQKLFNNKINYMFTLNFMGIWDWAQSPICLNNQLINKIIINKKLNNLIIDKK